MTLYILDTDHVTLFQHGHPNISQRTKMIDRSNLFITLITFEEQIRGRLAIINRYQTNAERLTIAYDNLRRTQDFFCSVNLLDFDKSASDYYQELRKQQIRIGTQDFKIASIALAHQAILVTRNQKDFSKVSNLTMEDWTELKS